MIKHNKIITTLLRSLVAVFIVANATAQVAGNIDFTFGHPVLTSGDTVRFDGYVIAIGVQPDGKAVMGGRFRNYNGIQNSKIIRLNTDGSIDTTFDTGAGFDSFSEVSCLAIQPDGKIIAGGSFTSFDGQTANHLIRLNPDGSADNTFITGSGFSGNVNSIALQPDGKIVVAGAFSLYKGFQFSNIIRIDSTGSIDAQFDLNMGVGFNDQVKAVILQPDGKILAGGAFTTYNQLTVTRMCRLNSDGSLDNNFRTNSGTGFNTTVSSLAIQPADGKILVGGSFTTYNSNSVNKIARLDSSGVFDPTFATGTTFGTANSLVYALLVTPNGNIVAGCQNGLIPGNIAGLNPDGSVNTGFLCYYGGFGSMNVYALAAESDGKILCGGGFSEYNSTQRNNICRIRPDGWIDHSYSVITGFDFGYVNKVTRQPDGKFLAGGSAVNYNGVYINKFTRINNDGSIDTSFHFNLLSPVVSKVNDIVYDTINNKIYMAGDFATGQNIIRLNTDGTTDNTFNTGTGFNDVVNSICLQADGKILAAGDFNTFNNVPANYIARINYTGTIDTSFHTGTGFDGPLSKALIQDNQEIMALGSYTLYNGSNCKNLIRMFADGSYDNSYQPALVADGSIAIQADNKILCGYSQLARLDTTGAYDPGFTPPSLGLWEITAIYPAPDGKIFFSINFGQRLTRLLADGTTDTSFFIPPSGFNNRVNSICADADKIIVAGGFNICQGYYMNRIVRLFNDINTSIPEITADGLFTVYPNPANDFFDVYCSGKFKMPVTAIIRNSLGITVSSFEMKNDRERIQLNQPTGIYFITLQDKVNHATQKLILK